MSEKTLQFRPVSQVSADDDGQMSKRMDAAERLQAFSERMCAEDIGEIAHAGDAGLGEGNLLHFGVQYSNGDRWLRKVSVGGQNPCACGTDRDNHIDRRVLDQRKIVCQPKSGCARERK